MKTYNHMYEDNYKIMTFLECRKLHMGHRDQDRKKVDKMSFFLK